MKVAIVHDWLTGMRGGEQVLENICSLYPEADIFTLFHFPGTVSELIEKHKIHTSFLQRLPWIKSLHRYYLPLYPTAIERFNLNGYDLIISLSHCVAKGVITPLGSLHISYMFTPMRYAWDLSWEYFETDKVPGVNKWIASMFLNYLRIWDSASMSRPDYILTISNFVSRRLYKYFKLDSTVIYPPVDTEFFVPGGRDEGYYLIVSALAPYKMIEVAIEAVKKLDRKLIIVGTGQIESKLKKISNRNVEFTGWVPKEEVRRLIQNSSAFILPGIEDFGIAVIEAQACGKPVIAYRKGGAVETVIPLDGDNSFNATGIFFDEQSPESLSEAIIRFEKNKARFNPELIRRNALRFSKGRFLNEFKNFVSASINKEKQKILKTPHYA